MNLSNILKDYGLDPKRTKLVRHPLSNKRVKKVYGTEYFEAYQNMQSHQPVFDKCDYVLSFLGTSGTLAEFIGCFKVLDKIENPDKRKLMPEGYPFPEEFDTGYYYKLVPDDKMSELIGKLVIDWGPSARSWHQWAKNEKMIVNR